MDNDQFITFQTAPRLPKDGKSLADVLKTAPIKTLSYSTVSACPNVIFDPSHYHDGTCDCYDQGSADMREWGYVWNGEHWDTVEDDD